MAVAVQDYIPELVGMSKANLDKDDESMLTSEKVLLKVRAVSRRSMGGKRHRPKEPDGKTNRTP